METQRTSYGRKALIAAFVCALALSIGALATALQPSKAYAAVMQSGATANSITVTWQDPYAGSSSYQTTGYKVSWGADYNSINKSANVGTSTSYTIGGLKAGTKYYVRVDYTYTYIRTGSTYSSFMTNYDVATRVVKPTGVKQTKWWYYLKAVDFEWDVQPAAQQVQYKLCRASNGKQVKSATNNYPSKTFTVNKVSNNVLYTVQLRVKDAYGWSAWSNKAYLFTQPMATKATKATNGKLTIAWGKISGATSYSVYVSNKEKKGYKKVSTVKSTKNKVTIKKFKNAKISKKKTYYVYVVANKKVGGKTYTSGKHYSYKVKGSTGTVRWTFD